MINVYKIKKYSALIFGPFITTISFALGSIFKDFWWGLLFMFIALIFSVAIASLLIKNPFSQMLEGKGVLAANLDSTGIMRFFLLKVFPPYMEGKFNKRNVSDVFDRDAVFNIEPTTKNDGIVRYNKDGSMDLHLQKDTAQNAKFMMMQYPMVIWNDHIKSVITKTWISEQEKDSFAEHGLLYLNRKVEELTSVMRDFARYIVEATRPKQGFFSTKTGIIVTIVIVIVVAIVIALFAPAIFNAIRGAASSGSVEALTSAKGTLQTIQPK